MVAVSQMLMEARTVDQAEGRPAAYFLPFNNDIGWAAERIVGCWRKVFVVFFISKVFQASRAAFKATMLTMMMTAWWRRRRPELGREGLMIGWLVIAAVSQHYSHVRWFIFIYCFLIHNLVGRGWRKKRRDGRGIHYLHTEAT